MTFHPPLRPPVSAPTTTTARNGTNPAGPVTPPHTRESHGPCSCVGRYTCAFCLLWRECPICAAQEGRLAERPPRPAPDAGEGPESEAELSGHAESCRWERTAPTECEYRATHHYCPHPEHACSCDPSKPEGASGPDQRGEGFRASLARDVARLTVERDAREREDARRKLGFGAIGTAPLTALEEALTLVYGDRNRDYGHPFDDYTRTATMVEAFLGLPRGFIGPRKMAGVMALVKLSREAHRPKRDNRVDLGGYAECMERIAQRDDELQRDYERVTGA